MHILEAFLVVKITLKLFYNMKNLYTAFFAAKVTIKLFLCIKNHYISSSPAENRPIAIKIIKTEVGVKPPITPYAHVPMQNAIF